MYVLKDDDRRQDEDWQTRKPSKRTLTRNQIDAGLKGAPIIGGLFEGKSGGIAATAVASAAAAAAPRVVRDIVKRSKAVGGVLATAAAGYLGVSTAALGGLLLAGAASYYGTRYVLEHFPTKARRLDAAADGYRRARGDLARALGRELTAEEQGKLSREYKATVAAINSF